MISYLALAAAFSHPRAVLMSAPQQRTPRLTRGRLAMLGLALLVLPVAIAATDLHSGSRRSVVLAVAAAVLAPLVLGRIATLASLHAAAERRLHTLATVDELTGLPNRRAISAHLTEILARCATADSPGVVVLFLDLDDFKLVNDGYGHATGDRLLVEVAQRLRSAVRSTDLVGRFGGDEFVVAMEGRPEATRDAALTTLSRALAAPVVLDDAEASAAASIGARLVRPGERVSAEQALSAADAAMYVVKRGHRSDAEVAGKPA
ncbi:GGDEF domain-containing protein [Isoptericola sp. b490]|uniref:GGDEF domain-containing protein n=1 Tax=Actinotalea lenta TaxID=3064654 RepID=UPI0027136FA7|nr:GGDEF domain-containing protein [Isoptericola sp. b490]MDO8122342.1 GGDEF domain-containing protein [Isoptericola sp. b490]